MQRKDLEAISSFASRASYLHDDLKLLQEQHEESANEDEINVPEELKRLSGMAVPLMIQNVFQFSIPVMASAFVGHLNDPVLLSAAVLATSFYNVTGWSVVIGLVLGMETLCGQAYGAKNYKALGIVLQRAILICWTCCIPVSLLWSQTHRLLGLLQQPPEVVEAAAHYLSILQPALYVSCVTSCLTRYLLAQRVVLPSMAITGITAVLSPVWNWLLIFKLGWGFQGAALAVIMSHVTNMTLMVSYAIFYRSWKLRGKPEQTWPGFSREALRGWGQYLQYGLPAAAMVCIEAWVWELMIFMSGVLPNSDLAIGVMGVCMQVIALIYMIPTSFGSACNTRIANELGAGHANAARSVFHLCFCVVLLLGVALVAALWLGRYAVFSIYTSSKEVIELGAYAAPGLVLSSFGDILNSVLFGVLRGAGRQGLGATINVGAYWLVGLPLAVYLGFYTGLNVLGLWLALACAILVQSFSALVIILRFDWDAEVKRAATAVASRMPSTITVASVVTISSALAEPLLGAEHTAGDTA